MLTFGILVVLFGVSAAIDLSGCYQQAKIITGFAQSTGEVTNPGYKEGQIYPDNLYCEYIIKASYGLRIKLKFLEMDVEASDMCNHDAVELVQLGQHPATLGVFCGNQTFPSIVSQTNEVSIRFRTDFMIGRRGFRIQYYVAAMPSECDHLGQIPCRNRNCYNPMDRCNGKDDCGDGSDEEGCGFPLKVTQCGIRKTSGFHSFDRVIGGKEVEPGSWPWQADLQLSYVYPNAHICGGTLINSQWVLSAAHCFDGFREPYYWRVHLGNHHKFKEDASEQIRYVERIILYPGTTGKDLIDLPEIDMNHDMSLVKLNAPVTFTDQVRPACLPMQGYELPVGKKCMATGWGTTRGTGSSDALKEVDLSVLGAQACQSINQQTMICVRNARGFQDVCHGDSGGPLVCDLNGKWHIMGATSFGTEGDSNGGGLCALPGSATVYSKVSHKTVWINQQINKYT